MSEKIKLAFNRVEGDLEIKVELKDNIVTESYCMGTMYRGFEQLMQGRAPWDGLVITPRICGICGTAHLYAAVTALETAQQCKIAPNGTRIRNICLMAEEIQSDSRHTFLMFMIDMCNTTYSDIKYYPLVMEAFEPYKGRIYKEVIENTKKILEIVSIFGGQWPHSSYMVPGGVTISGSNRQVNQSMPIIDKYIRWYEKSIIGCSTDRWLSVKTLNDLEVWFDESEDHRKTKFGRSLGLHKSGKSNMNLMNFGAYYDPEKWQPPFDQRICFRAPGIYNLATNSVEPFDQSLIQEHVKHSWFKEYDGGKHPFDGETIPVYSEGDEKYSWSKAPRYNDKPMETGPLAQMVISGDPLMNDIFKREGSTVWSRQFTRMHRPVSSLQKMKSLLLELQTNKTDLNIIQTPELSDGEGIGLVEAARGSLGHWIKVVDKKIKHYQIISPTSWNSSPRDSAGVRGQWEEALIGTQIKDIKNPIEIGHIIRSYDACQVCAVHYLDTGAKYVYNI